MYNTTSYFDNSYLEYLSGFIDVLKKLNTYGITTYNSCSTDVVWGQTVLIQGTQWVIDQSNT